MVFTASLLCSLVPRVRLQSVPGVTRSDLDMLQSLLAKFGLNAPNISTPSPPVAYTVSVPPGFQSVSAQLSAQPTYVSPQLLPGSFGVSNMGMAGLFPQGVQYPTGSPQQGVHYPQQGVQTLSGPPQGVHLVPGTSQNSCQFNLLHGVNSRQGGFLSLFGSLGQHLIGDGRFIPVTNSGHSVFELITRRVLLRCDSTGELYPVTKPSTIPHAFLTKTSHSLPCLSAGKHVEASVVSSPKFSVTSFLTLFTRILGPSNPSLSVFPFPSTKSTTTPSYDFLDDSTDLISTIIRTAPITPVPAPVHTPLVDVPTPPTPPPPPTRQSVPQIVPEHAPALTNDPAQRPVSISSHGHTSRVGLLVLILFTLGHSVRVLHVPSRFQYADIFTKGLPSALFEEFRTSLSIRCPPAPTAGEC
ncbi:hypothetical protein Tco_0406938 [Tanacetum coccineum]